MALIAGWLSVGVGSAQTVANLNILSGDGQVNCPYCPNNLAGNYQPLVVQATDSFGNPVSGATITWELTTGGGQFLNSGNGLYTATTDSNGMASVTYALFSQQGFSQFTSYVQSTITANAGSLTDTFVLTQGLQLFSTILATQPVTAIALPQGSLQPGTSFSGQIGTTGSPITVQVLNADNTGIPNVAVFLVNVNTNGATMQCAGTPGAGPNVVLTDSNGKAVCNPIFGGVPGTGQVYVDVGGAEGVNGATPSAYITFPSSAINQQSGLLQGFTYTVTPGLPGSITAVSGGGQSANPGQALARPLVAQVNNASGQPLSGIAVNWTVSPANAASLSASTTTGSNGQTSNNVTLASSAGGTVTVTASTAGVNGAVATYTITVVPLVTITSFQIVSGNNQSAPENTAFAQPLAVLVGVSGGSASGVPVQFKVQSGSVTLSSTSATTNAIGLAQVNATAGATPGTATVVASVSTAAGSSSQTFSLTVLPPGPAITTANFYNGADLQPLALSPCGWGALIGSGPLGISDVAPLFPGQPAPQSNVSLTFNSINAPVIDIGTNALGKQQIIFQVPCELSPASSVPVIVNIAGSTTNLNLAVQPAAPGVFQTLMSDGVVRALLVRPDGSFVSVTNPARRGETVVAYVTGLGVTSPSVATGSVPVPGTVATVLGTVIPGMAGGGPQLVSAQLSEDLPGVYVVAFQVPTNISPGNNVTFSIGIIPVGGSTAFYSATTKVNVQ